MTAEQRRDSQRLRRTIPFRSLIPNAITLAALCFGLTGVRLAIGGDFEKALVAVVTAGVLDGLDGRVARLLKGTSRFGAELDSLSDLTAHGVAPALIIYLWSLNTLPGVGWLIALTHAACCALRLARFNAAFDTEDGPMKAAGFFTGVPAPLGAGLTLLPLTFWLWLGEDIFREPLVVGVVVVTTALLMISSLPTWSWSKLRIKPEWRLLALAFVAVVAGGLFSSPWMTLSLIGIAYLISIPFSYLSYQKVKQRTAKPPAETGAS